MTLEEQKYVEFLEKNTNILQRLVSLLLEQSSSTINLPSLCKQMDEMAKGAI